MSARQRAVVAQRVEPRAEQRLDRHDEALAQVVDRRVRHLCEALPEVGREAGARGRRAARSARRRPSTRRDRGRSARAAAASSSGPRACSRAGRAGRRGRLAEARTGSPDVAVADARGDPPAVRAAARRARCAARFRASRPRSGSTTRMPPGPRRARRTLAPSGAAPHPPPRRP